MNATTNFIQSLWKSRLIDARVALDSLLRKEVYEVIYKPIFGAASVEPDVFKQIVDSILITSFTETSTFTTDLLTHVRTSFNLTDSEISVKKIWYSSYGTGVKLCEIEFYGLDFIVVYKVIDHVYTLYDYALKT